MNDIDMAQKFGDEKSLRVRTNMIFRTLAVLLAAAILLLVDFNGSISKFLISTARADFHISRTHVIGETTIETFYNDQQVFLRQVRTSFEGDTKVTRTVNATGAVVEISRITETPTGDDPTIINDDPSIINREVRIKRYVPGSRVPYETVVIFEQTKLMATTDRVATEYTEITNTYTQRLPRELLKSIVEKHHLTGIDKVGVPVGEVTRTTTTPDGIIVEIFDPYSKEWEIAPEQSDPENKGSSSAPNTENSSSERCADAKSELDKLTIEEQDLLEVRSELVKFITQLRNSIEKAIFWEGLPRRYKLLRTTSEDGKNTIWRCTYCMGPEKLALNRLHANLCPIDPGAVYHPEPLPRDVEEFRWIFEANLRADYEDSLKEYELCGGSIPPSATAVYTNWHLRDQYLEMKEPTLDLNVEHLALIDDQLSEIRKRMQQVREIENDNCEKPSTRIPSAFGKPRPPSETQTSSEEPVKRCGSGSMVDGVLCVEEQMGD